ncbi:MAG: type II toxin-antitoxin system PemK/MazF family toxin [Pirellulales bacterium]|nr:type II toxin-antitoxin system PemK/MazF family toxin [Pirellulales bacterium]
MSKTPAPKRGEVWDVDFDPPQGAEIGKTRPAIVISEDVIGRLPLRIVVPVTDWKAAYANWPWFVHLVPSSTNGLSKESGADAFQVKSVSERRFVRRRGVLVAASVDDIAATIAICVGAP